MQIAEITVTLDDGRVLVAKTRPSDLIKVERATRVSMAKMNPENMTLDATLQLAFYALVRQGELPKPDPGEDNFAAAFDAFVDSINLAEPMGVSDPVGKVSGPDQPTGQ